MLELDEILTQCRSGNALAWEALVRRYQGKIYSMALYYLKNTQEAQDVTEDIFIRIYKGLSLDWLQNWRPLAPMSLGAWLFYQAYDEKNEVQDSGLYLSRLPGLDPGSSFLLTFPSMDTESVMSGSIRYRHDGR